MFEKILIANRGEIACRIIRTARRLNIRTVAVYSDADANAQHVRLADEAYLLGPAPSRESYLRMDRIIEIAKKSGAQAIHPGYGFLSENADFSRACADSGVVFIGPRADAITAMGSKSGAKTLMEAAGVPLIPGYHGDNQEDAHLLETARHIGFPVLLKASAGGGGKGMRAVHAESEFVEALQGARREAQSAFGDSRMLIEKLLLEPRHVEVQLMADRHGQAFYIFDRDCSLQRRHQKVVEEAPAPGLPEMLRTAMGQAATKAALAIGYEGAGTIEFLVQDNAFYFMEMNTRLQVEHPVTECVSGLDLVELQLRVAAGEKLALVQRDLKPKGHAIEVRLYAEDPENDFLPSTGTLTRFDLPLLGNGVRVDSGFVAGDVVSVHYDPMIAKVIAWGDDRTLAIRRLRQALEQVKVAGVRHNAAFLHRVLGIPAFADAELTTRFLEHHRSEWAISEPPPAETLIAAALYFHENDLRELRQQSTDDGYSPWQSLTNFRLFEFVQHTLVLEMGEARYTVRLRPQGKAGYNAQVDDTAPISVIFDMNADLLVVNGTHQRTEYAFHYHGKQLHLYANAQHFVVSRHVEDHNPAQQHAGSRHYQAPMNGRVIQVTAETGQAVKKGDTLLVMEAMKMEHRIRAHADGKIVDLFAATGDLVNEGQRLLDLEAL